MRLQLEPMLVSAVAAHWTVNAHGASVLVAASIGAAAAEGVLLVGLPPVLGPHAQLARVVGEVALLAHVRDRDLQADVGLVGRACPGSRRSTIDLHRAA